MILGTTLFKRVTIVGVGFMGGSLGLAMKKYKLAKKVVGLSHEQSDLTKALKHKAIDIAETDIQKALKGSDLVIMATPVESIIKLLSAISPYVRRGAIITDVGSSKSEIVEYTEKTLQQPNLFVGAHPLVGSEKRGIEFSDADLFTNTCCIITPTDKTHKGSVGKIKKLWTKVGAKVSILKTGDHDKILSYTSHLPHLVAYALMRTIPKENLRYSSGGLRDTTRIASSSAQMWNDICMSNARNIVQVLDEYVDNLAQLRSAIVDLDRKSLVQYFTKAQEKRDDFFKGK